MQGRARTTPGAVAIVLIARMSSSRLSGKSALQVHGRALILHQIERLRGSKNSNMIILATTTRKDDDALETLAKDADILSFRGAELDVVERLVQVGRYFGLDFLVCVGGDDIFCEAAQVDELIAAYADTHADFLTIKGLPLGTTPYAVRYEALEKLLQLKGNRTTDGWERYFVDSGRFNVVDLPTRKQDPGAQQLRLTLDYPEDFQLISKIYDRLSKSGEEPPLQRVIDLLLHDEPQLALINRSRQSEWEAARPLINL